jgi:hypothetical protein
MDALDEIAAELYALPPEQFTAARNEAAAATPALAPRIKELRKHSPAAWLANLLARNAALDDLLALGSDMRSTTDRDELAALTKRRRSVVSALVAQAGTLAGKKPSATVADELAQTLQAAITDPAAADAFRTGRLVRSLAAVGFEAVDLEGAVAGDASAPKRATPPRDELAEKRLEHARREAADAEKRARDAAASVTAVDTEIAATVRRRGVLDAELAELEQRVRDTKRAVTAADREARSLEREREKAARAADQAAEALESARAKLD